jgi:hypothetical protein
LDPQIFSAGARSTYWKANTRFQSFFTSTTVHLLSKFAMRWSDGAKSGPPAVVTTKSVMDFFVAPSFQDGNGSDCACAPCPFQRERLRPNGPIRSERPAIFDAASFGFWGRIVDGPPSFCRSYPSEIAHRGRCRAGSARLEAATLVVH